MALLAPQRISRGARFSIRTPAARSRASSLAATRCCDSMASQVTRLSKPATKTDSRTPCFARPSTATRWPCVS